MNRVFRIIWSKSLRAWVVASEFAMRNGKGGGGVEVDERREGASPQHGHAGGGWPVRACAVAVLFALYTPAWAADMYWDFNGFNPSTMGGTGTWDLTSQFWDYGAVHNGTTGPYRAWNNAALDDAFFQGTAGTVTLAQPITAHNLTFSVNGYTLTGGQLTLGGTTPTIFAVGNATINSVVAGSAGLTKEGGGVLTLTGTNSFSGGIFLNAGTLSADDNAALGAAGNTITTATGASVSFAVTGGPVNRTVIIGNGGTVAISGAAGSAFYTGSGNLSASAGTTLSNDNNDFTGTVTLNGVFVPASAGHVYFTSVRNVGENSSLGAGGTITFTRGDAQNYIHYTGDGDSSNRNWVMAGNSLRRFHNNGTGTLTLTGNFDLVQSTLFNAETADFDLRGVLSGGAPGVTFTASTGRSVTLAGANTFTGDVTVSGGGTINASVLANAGSNSSLGAGNNISLSGTLNYTGGAATTDRDWDASGTLNNTGSGALVLTGDVAATGTFTLGGGASSGVNTISGLISGVGGLRSNGTGTWLLSGANTFSGAVTVDSGTLRAGGASAFGNSTAFTVNGGTLDLNGYSKTVSALDGSGGNVALGGGTLTVNKASGTSTYSGIISGSGGLTKLGLGTLTLKGANTYTGATTVNNGTLALDFTGAGGPSSNIISSASTLNLGGGTVNVIGSAGESNSQSFNGLNVITGNSTLRSTSGAGGSVAVNLGTITYNGGVLNFALPTAGGFTTTNADGALGGWATINGSDYAKVVGGNIVAFTAADYTAKDNAGTWLTGEVITDTQAPANSPFFGLVNSNIQLGGLRYTAAANSTVTVDSDNTLAVGGTIIVAPTVGNANLSINGGSLTGGAGGTTLGIQQNGGAASNFIIGSTIVDNGGSTSFAKNGTGLVTLSGNNTYTGATTVSQGVLSVSDIGMGGAASNIGASSADASNLLLQGGELRYTGTGDTTDRGFTLMRNGPITSGTINVTGAAANLRFDGEVISPDDAGLVKTGAGTLTLGNGNNSYTGVTTVSGGTLAVTTLANGGSNSSIGASSSDSSKLVLQSGGELEYMGGTVSTDRGFTLGTGGGQVDVAQGGTTLTIGGTVVGSGTLTKNGLGTLVLSGANTFTSGGFVNGGILQAGSSQAFGTGGWTIASGATFDLNDFNSTVGMIAGGGTVDLGTATLTINNASAGFPFTGNIIGTGGLAVTGGTQVLNGCGNSYTGVTTITGATLSTDCLRNSGLASGIGASSNISGGLVIGGNGTLSYTGTSTSINRGFTLSGSDGYINVNAAATTLGFSGQITGPGRLRKNGAGTLVLSNTNNYTGSTVIDEGILRAGAANAFGTGRVDFNGPGATLDLDGFNTTIGGLQSNAVGWGTVQLDAATLTLGAGSGTYSGVIEGTGSVVKQSGHQILAGCNSTYDGSTTINGGTLSVQCLSDGGFASSIGDSGTAASNLVINAGNLRYIGDGDSTNRQFTINGNSTLEASGTGAIEYTNTAAITMAGAGARTLTLQGTNTGNNTLAARIDDLSPAARTTLVKSDSGTWVLTNQVSTYTGVTRIDGGVLAVSKLDDGGQASSIGMSGSAATNLIIGAGATLRYVGAGDSTDRQFTLLAGTTFIESSGTGTIDFSNTGAVTLNGTGAHTVSLGGTNTGFNTFGSTLADASATGRTTLSKYGTGTWVLTGNNTYTGDTVINQGNLMIGNGGTTGNAGAGNVFVQSSDSTLSFNRSDTFNFAGSLTGAGNIAQVGTGTTVLTAANNTIGGVTGVDAGTLQIASGSNLTTGSAEINAGTLQIQAGGSLTTPSIAMNAGSTLNVNGTAQAAGATASVMTGDAGNSTINVSTGGVLRANGDLGGGSDVVNVSGTLDTGAAVLNLGDGNDTLALNDSAVITGAGVNGGLGTGDILQVNNAAPRTISSSLFAGFERLIKQGLGILTATGNHLFSAGTDIAGGTLDVDGSVTTPTVTMADGTTLNVDGTLEAAGATAAMLTGSAGVNTVLVNTGATLRANGDLGAGNDVVTLAGTLDTGAAALNLGSGDDTLTLNDGAAIAGMGIDAGAQTTNDVLILNNALGLSFDGSRTAGFESLIKQNTGTATMTGSQTFSAGTELNDGALTVAGDLTTPTVAMADGTTLNVDGALQGIGGTAAAITGDAGVQTVTITGTATVTGDLGAGNDTLDVSGTMDIGGGVFALGDGDDNFVVHDGTVVNGTIDGGAGLDSRTYDINTVADLGSLLNFEGVTKTGTGILNINGPGATDLQEVEVLGGTLHIGAGASVVATAGSALNTVVGSGATLNVDGSFGCGAQADTMTVSGTVSGSGTVDLCGGDDTLTLNDGASLLAIVDGGTGAADTVVLNNTGTLGFDSSNTVNFEVLQKDNVGEALLTGGSTFTGGTLLDGGTLTVLGSLTTPTVAMTGGTTLNVGGTLQGVGGTAAQINGGNGVETVNITGIAMAGGDLGGGNDTLDVTGTLDTDGGVFALGDGDDSFVVHDGTVVNGTIDGGAGLDSRIYHINGIADLGALINFEGVTKTGTGTLNINGPIATDLQDVQVLGGTLNVGAAGSVVGQPGQALNTVVGSGATLNVDGTFGCGDSADAMTVAGTVSGTGMIDLCGGDDTLTLNDGAVLANVIDGGANGVGDRVVLNNAGAMTFDGANTIGFEILQKDNIGEATLTGVSTYSGGTSLNGGTLTVAGDLSTPTLAMGDGTRLNVDGTLQGTGGAAANITGSAGINTVTVASGATMTAIGDLGDGNDVLDAAGAIDTDGGVFSLGAGDDTFNVYDTTDTSLATIDGGAGNDLLDVNVGAGNTVPLGGLTNFESLGKSGDGALEIHGASSFIDVNLNDGTLRVTGTGSIAANHTNILSGATLELADGGIYSGTAGDDTFTVAGTVLSTGSPNTGRIDLGDGNDTFTIQDDADLSSLAPEPVSGGAGTDTFVADLAGTATLGGAIDFETLTKTNTGTLIVAGPAASSFSTVNVLGGTLDVGLGGSLTGVQNATVASGATLNIAGAFGFTNGADNFTVAGIVTGSSAIDMLDGDDTFTIQDGADLSGLAGPVDGGTGNDTFVSDIAGTATLGGAVNFETLNKTGIGTLVVAGPAASAFTTVNVDGGTLDIGVNGAIDGVTAGTVASGATMNVDGRYTGSAGSDTLTVAGTVRGSGDIALGDGDDILTLNDGADLSGLTGALDGGAHGAGDRVVLNNAGAMTFDAGNVINFEFLQKDNTGEATLTGSAAFGGGTALNGGTLTVAGDLTTPMVAMADGTILGVDGTLQGAGGTAATITGSAGVNTVTVTGTAIAIGDLGAGNDVLDVTGTLDTDGGVFGLGDGDDDFVVHDGTVVTGTIDGGAGLDSRVYDINGTAEFGALLNFEGVTKRGTGTLNISGPGATDLQSVEVEGGTLNIGAAASVVATAGSALNTVVASGATLNVDGSFGCGDSADTMTVAGTVSGSGTIAMCGGDDTLTLQDGATLANIVDGGADTDTVVLDNAAAMSFDGANTINFEVLQKDNMGEATLTGTSTYTGGTLLNGGTLTVAGSLTTPTLALADGTTLNVDGTVQGTGGAAAITGSAGVNTVNVTGSLQATGDLGAGSDVLDVTGTLDTSGGVFALGDGDDILTIHDGTNIVGTVAAGAGNDTFNTDIATNADLGAVQGFETLSKTGIGTLDINGPMSSDFSTVNVLAGTLNVAAGGSVVAQNSTVASGATLQIAGSYSGTAGNDSFTSMGTVQGRLDFGDGADTARFIGGNIGGLTGLEGGAGSGDLLSFSGLELGDTNVSSVTNWERVELLDNSRLTLGTAFNGNNGVLAIDATSRLLANAGASIGGSVENAGLVNVGANRLAIGGGYSSNGGTLQLTVSPGNANSGGLNVAGDVVGTTRVVFDSDGSSPAADAATSILVISSPNDNTATAGGFVPSDSQDGFVRLEGSVNPWTFGQQADNNWYLNAETASLLPEISGYAVLPSLGTLLSRQSSDLVHQRLAGVRSTERPQCGGHDAVQSARGGATADVIDDCHGLWVAATASELELGANPGFEVSGDDVGLYVGIDGDLERGNRTIRAGGYVGFTHGVYWTTGASSTELAGTGPARIDIDSPVVGMYANTEWHNGNYLDLVLSGHRPGADIRTADGFSQRVTGNYLTLSARVGRSYHLDNGWAVEPQLQLTASHTHWADTIDAAGRKLVIDDDVAGTARAALRVEKAFTTAGGASIKPWLILGVQNVVGEKENGMYLGTPTAMDAAQAFPGHDLGTSANLDLGVEAAMNQRLSLFGVVSVGQSIDGSDLEQRSANLGLRLRW